MRVLNFFEIQPGAWKCVSALSARAIRLTTYKWGSDNVRQTLRPCGSSCAAVPEVPEKARCLIQLLSRCLPCAHGNLPGFTWRMISVYPLSLASIGRAGVGYHCATTHSITRAMRVSNFFKIQRPGGPAPEMCAFIESAGLYGAHLYAARTLPRFLNRGDFASNEGLTTSDKARTLLRF